MFFVVLVGEKSAIGIDNTKSCNWFSFLGPAVQSAQSFELMLFVATTRLSRTLGTRVLSISEALVPSSINLALTRANGVLRPSEAQVSGIAAITPTVKLLELKVPDTITSFVAGQCVELFVPDESATGANSGGLYSACSAPTDLPRLCIAVKDSLYPPTAWCYNAATVGDRVRVRIGGEFGLDLATTGGPSDGPCVDPRFELPPDATQLVLVAGGIGISPLICILRHIAHCADRSDSSSHRLPQRVHLIFGARGRSELAFEAEIAAMAGAFDKVRPTCSAQLTR